MDLHRIPQALEDLPPQARARAARIGGKRAGRTLRQRIVDELEDVLAGSYGNLERAPLLHFLSRYPVRPYTYGISPVMSRGQRPSPQKLEHLFSRERYRATINLCAEMTSGDTAIIGRAGLAAQLHTYHIPIVDMEPPRPAQVIQLLDILTGPEAQLTYVHCEAGMGRTGVMTACYRMAVMGWSIDDALTEAKNFGCFIPMQQAFIQQFGMMLRTQRQTRGSNNPPSGGALGRYPLKRLGSVKATTLELTATLAGTARQEKTANHLR
jgi:protein-tyrosine phosphatase